mgnify:CR=1 FL=1
MLRIVNLHMSTWEHVNLAWEHVSQSASVAGSRNRSMPIVSSGSRMPKTVVSSRSRRSRVVSSSSSSVPIFEAQRSAPSRDLGVD